jgi:hypothetical protein
LCSICRYCTLYFTLFKKYFFYVAKIEKRTCSINNLYGFCDDLFSFLFISFPPNFHLLQATISCILKQRERTVLVAILSSLMCRDTINLRCLNTVAWENHSKTLNLWNINSNINFQLFLQTIALLLEEIWEEYIALYAKTNVHKARRNMKIIHTCNTHNVISLWCIFLSILPGFVDCDYIHHERNSNEPNPRTLYILLHTYMCIFQKTLN